MSDELNLGGGEESPPMPAIPDFLLRVKPGEIAAIIDEQGNGSMGYRAPEPIAESVPPTRDDLIALLDKLVAKRDKIEASIVEVKKQIIEQVRLA